MESKGFFAGSWADRRKQIHPVSISQTQRVTIGHPPGRAEQREATWRSGGLRMEPGRTC